VKPNAESLIPASIAPVREQPPQTGREARMQRSNVRYNPAPTRIRRLAAKFWLNYFFWHGQRFPRITRWTKWIYLIFALYCSKTIQYSTQANARRILGNEISDKDCRIFARKVVSHFFDFVADVARSIEMTREQLLNEIAKIHGEDNYLAAREKHRGAIIATLHMGSFEVAAAALHLREQRIHVVFKRDHMNRFDKLRSAARQKLDIIEAPIDEGWGMWVGLRDALQNDEVVMLQADRVMPGQKGMRLPFLYGHLLLPTGPVRLAMLTGSPIIPIVSLRKPDGKIEIHIEEAIWVSQEDSIEQAMGKVKTVVEKYVREYPTQWLMLEPAFCEDQA
jgi:KDO2-lipid IV(A) lauroyltransferase